MNDGRRTRLPSFEPSRCDKSNSGGSVLLSPLDAEIIGKTSMNQLFIDVLPIISVSNDCRKTKLPSFDSSYRNGSDGSNFVLLTPLDAEIISKTLSHPSVDIKFSSFHLVRFCHSFTRCELES